MCALRASSHTCLAAHDLFHSFTKTYDVDGDESHLSEVYYQNAIVSLLISVGKLGLEQGSVIIHLPFSNFFEGEMRFNLVLAVFAENRFVINADSGLYDDQHMDAAIARIVTGRDWKDC
jgi:hypothetical protein